MSKYKLSLFLILLVSCSTKFNCNSIESKEDLKQNSVKFYYLFLFEEGKLSLIPCPIEENVKSDEDLNDKMVFNDNSSNVVLEKGNIKNGIKNGLWEYIYIQNESFIKKEIDWLNHSNSVDLKITLPSKFKPVFDSDHYFKANYIENSDATFDSGYLIIDKFLKSAYLNLDTFETKIKKQLKNAHNWNLALNYDFIQDNKKSIFILSEDTLKENKSEKYILLIELNSNYYKIEYNCTTTKNRNSNSLEFFEIIRNMKFGDLKPINYISSTLFLR